MQKSEISSLKNINAKQPRIMDEEAQIEILCPISMCSKTPIRTTAERIEIKLVFSLQKTCLLRMTD